MGPLSTPNKFIPAMKRINQPYYSKIVQTVPNSPIYVHNENNNNNNQSTVQTKTVLGLLPFNPVPSNFGWYIKLEQAISVKIVVPSTALLYSAYKNNNQTRGGLVRRCTTEMHRSIGHVECPNF